MKWTTTTFVVIGALAALNLVLHLPGAIAAAVTGIYIASDIANTLVIGVAWALVALIMKRVGAVTLWAIISGILFVPFPLAGPPGLILKVIYMGMWGVATDIVYFIFRRSERLTAVAIGILQVGPGAALVVIFWGLLGQEQLATEVTQNIAPFVIPIIIVGTIVGALLGLLAHFIYSKIENTAVIRRIQQG